MALPGRTLVTDLAQGHEFPAATFTLSRDRVTQYLAAVEDELPIYLEHGVCPTLAVVTVALGSILDLIELPAGTLHTSQEVEQHAGVLLDLELTLTGRVARRSERAGLAICVIEFEVALAGAPSPAVTGRTTVMAPLAGMEAAR